MESHMLCLKHRKSLKGRKPKKIISLPSVKKKYSVKKPLSRVSKKTLGKLSFLLSAKNNTLGKELFVKCEEKTLGKNSSLPSIFILPSVFLITLGKELFTECSK